MTSALTTLFESAGCVKIEPPVLQPADLFLNAAGEAFRKSLFVTNSANGKTLCLRPEFTIPVCLAHQGGEARYHYEGTVFRQAEGGEEFQQAGVEALGDEDYAKADADMVRLALDAVQALSDVKPLVLIGDPAFFNALVTPIGLPEIWCERLTRAFGDEALVSTMLQRMITAPVVPDKEFRSGDLEELTAQVTSMMVSHGVFGAGGRTPQEIAARVLKKRDEQVPVSAQVSEVCQLFLALECAGKHVSETMTRFGKQYSVDFKEAIAGYEARAAGLESIDADMTFAASFGRRLDYYTGFVFEIYDANDRAKGPLAGGGRYDRLVEMLGGKPQPAVGFSLWLDRLSQGAA